MATPPALRAPIKPMGSMVVVVVAAAAVLWASTRQLQVVAVAELVAAAPAAVAALTAPVLVEVEEGAPCHPLLQL